MYVGVNVSLTHKSILAAALLLVVSLASAQEINIAIGLGGRPAARTIFDEIEDLVERSAFREVWDTTDPRAQSSLAMRFVDRYPRSILLREAYELAARASVAAGDLAAGLSWGKRALRLMPENPFLLAMLADIAARHGDLDLALTSARDALSYLEQADAPSPITPAEWPKARATLRAAALYVVGRVAASRENYKEAEQSLMASLTLNPDDIEALYTIAVVRMAVRADMGAARAFARVARTDTPLAGAAREYLRVLYARNGVSGKVDFNDWTASLKWTPPEPAQPAPAAEVPGRYAGSAACRTCHARAYESWQATGMARMFRAYRSSDIIGDFSGAQTVSDHARPITVGSRHFIEIRNGNSGEWVRYPVDYVIGSKWQQAYATRLPDARLLVFPIQYSKLQSAWVNYWKIVDGPGSPRTDIARFHEVPEGAVYQTSCAACHTSQLSFPDGASRPSLATFREGGINCEMCHGPSRDHVEAMTGGAKRTVTASPVRFRSLAADQYVAVCAQCHAQSAVHDAQPGGAVNYSATGAPFRTYPMALPSDFARKAFYRDGRYRATTFISEAFARSECYRKGGATCGSCHDPHPPDPATNPTSLKFAGDSDAMCVQCHSAIGQRPERHTRHAAGTEASRCVSCHMPRIMEAVLFQARSHEIDDVPDAEMTGRFGAADSPNACLTCHRDRDTAWLRTSLASFTRVN
jgi:predicted CXXCH cytochrome family protein